MKISDDAREKLRAWLGKTLKIVITDGRIIVGSFVCTDRVGNVILETSFEYSDGTEGIEDPRPLGLALVPGEHIISMALKKQ